jgi:hypothetical protein
LAKAAGFGLAYPEKSYSYIMSDYQLVRDEQTIDWFIDTVLVRDIATLIRSGTGYLAFSVISQGIELLGAFLDEQEFNDSNLSEDRFRTAIRELFPRAYSGHSTKGSEFYLYEDLRCGMAHVLRPQGRIGFVGRSEALHLGILHLQKVPYENTALLVLVLEDFYDDFADACRKAKNRIKKKSHAKLNRGYLTFYRSNGEGSSAVPTLSSGPAPEFSLKTKKLPSGTITGAAFQQQADSPSVD